MKQSDTHPQSLAARVLSLSLALLMLPLSARVYAQTTVTQSIPTGVPLTDSNSVITEVNPSEPIRPITNALVDTNGSPSVGTEKNEYVYYVAKELGKHTDDLTKISSKDLDQVMVGVSSFKGAMEAIKSSVQYNKCPEDFKEAYDGLIAAFNEILDFIPTAPKSWSEALITGIFNAMKGEIDGGYSRINKGYDKLKIKSNEAISKLDVISKRYGVEM